MGWPQPCRVPRRSSKCLDVPAVGEDTDGPQGRECQKEIQGFPSSPLEPRIPSAPSPISLSQQGKLEEVKGRLFQRTEVIKIKSLSAAERSLQKARKLFPSCSPLLFLCPSPPAGRGSLVLTGNNGNGSGRGPAEPHARMTPLGKAFFPLHSRSAGICSLAFLLPPADTKAKKLSGA